MVQAQQVDLDRLFSLREGERKFSIGDRQEWTDPNYDDFDWWKDL